MKKIIFYVLLIASCFATNSVSAQCSFTYCIRQNDANKGNEPWRTSSTFATKEECESQRISIASVQTDLWGQWLIRVETTPCMCTGNSTSMSGDVQFNALGQGNSFYSPNQGQAMVDAMEQKKLMNEKLLAGDNSNRTITRNRAFDNAYAKLAQGRPGNGYFQPIEYNESGGLKMMKELGASVGLNFSDYISDALWNKVSNNLKNCTQDELMKFNGQYNRFVAEVNRRQGGIEVPPLFGEAFINKAIDVGADIVSVIATGTAAFLTDGIGLAAEGAISGVVYASAEGLKAANSARYGHTTSGKDMTVNTIKKMGGILIIGGGTLLSSGISKVEKAFITNVSKEHKAFSNYLAKSMKSEQKLLPYERKLLLPYERTQFSASKIKYLFDKYPKNQGAVKNIINKYGDDGIKALAKADKFNFDEVANELLKGKTAYRYVGSDSKYLETIKKEGIIPSSQATYFTLDKYEDAQTAIDKIQILSNKEGKLNSDMVWRLEFNADPLVGKSEFPNAQYGKYNYPEPVAVTYHYDANGGNKPLSGGASQFTTREQIKLNKMVNLITGETIYF